MYGAILEKGADYYSYLYKISYKLDTVRNDHIMVEAAILGQRWEVEFSPDGDVVVERFKSFDDVGDEKLLDHLFENFSD
ncbi:MAG TPA: hypothetical protein GX707_10500 [Epulopiscium sp.]|nr:hypothetical protein [Candidatus Epulonipiscium sp.]